MDNTDFTRFPWITPWQAISERGRVAYEHELHLETSPGHPLFETPVTAIGRTCHDDNVLFKLHQHPAAFAVVHLTFRGRSERDVKWPCTILYRDLDHWVTAGLIPDAANYEIRQSDSAA
jgi:hypothetical protein